MPETLLILLSLNANECIRGESVFFDIQLKNVGDEPVENLDTFNPFNEATYLVAAPVKTNEPAPIDESIDDGGIAPPTWPPPGHIAGHAHSALERNGIHRHGPPDPELITLSPGESLAQSGDVLQWLGELEPGTYEITAQHRGAAEMIVSQPVQLTVHPAKPIALSTPRSGPRGLNHLNSSAWLHGQDNGGLVFYQLQSAILPRTPMRGLRVGEAADLKQLTVATVPAPNAVTGHVLWRKGSGLMMATVDSSGQAPPQVVDVQGAPRGTVLQSPLSLPDGSAFALIAPTDASSLKLIHIQPSGQAQSFNLDLGKSVPFGTYSCCWQVPDKLQFAWVGPKGRAVSILTVLLDDPESGTQLRSVYLSGDPVQWVEMYLDPSATAAYQPAFEHNTTPDDRGPTEPPAPLEMLWLVTQRGDQLRCLRGMVGDPNPKVMAQFDIDELTNPRVITSAVTGDHQLALLLADEEGTLHYASTAGRTLVPLDQAAGRPVGLDQQPGLMASGNHGALPWVYLRCYDAEAGRIVSIKLEPANEKEPELNHHH